jgi:hypothetical protein
MRFFISIFSISFMLFGCKIIQTDNSQPISKLQMQVHNINGEIVPNKTAEIRIVEIQPGINTFEIK